MGRKTPEKLTDDKYFDDKIRASIIKALEFGECENFDEFCDFVLPDIRKTLLQYPESEHVLAGLLKQIQEEHIVVIESGCYGTFPMLLKSLDSRIDIRMYTTVPYLHKIYSNKIYTKEYEKNRQFETLYFQDLYLRFSDLREGKFYVNKCENTEVEEKAFAEVKSFL